MEHNDLKRKELKVGVFDLETTGLRADYGYLLCMCVLDPRTGKIITVRIDDPRNPDPHSDKWVVRETIKVLKTFDLLVGWNTTSFDLPFLNTRAIKHRLKPYSTTGRFWRDLIYTSRFKLRLRSNRLAVVGEFLFGKSIKNSITPKMWNGAIRGDKKSLNYVVYHCKLDLWETLRVYKRFIPLLGKLRRR